MMASRHTPGPWTYDGPMGKGKVRDRYGFSVAMYVDESDGNLIAAAPDLLAVLEALDRHEFSSVVCHHPVHWGGNYGDESEQHSELCIMAKAAIAKAKG